MAFFSDERKEEEADGSGAEAPESLSDKLEYIDQMFPFASAEKGTSYACPYWVKCLLKEKYNLNQIIDVIKYLN